MEKFLEIKQLKNATLVRINLKTISLEIKTEHCQIGAPFLF